MLTLDFKAVGLLESIYVINYIKSGLRRSKIGQFLLQSHQLLLLLPLLLIRRLNFFVILLEKVAIRIVWEKWVQDKIGQGPTSNLIFVRILGIYEFIVNPVEYGGVNLMNRPLPRQILVLLLIIKDAIELVIVLHVWLYFSLSLEEIVLRLFNYFDLAFLMAETA